MISTPDGTQLCVESLGDDGAPVLLLIAGLASSMDFWDGELCERLAGRGLRVVRYDHRDTGRSTSWPAGAPGYTGRDLTEDAVAVLDGLGIERAHVAGLSAGGGIAQELGLAHRDRVRSLTLMSTTFARDSPDGLPGPVPDDGTEYEEHNHWLVEQGESVPGHITDLASLPVLVVHGTADPLFPIEHGRALAAALDARLLELEGVGHDLPSREHWDRLVDALVEVVSEA